MVVDELLVYPCAPVRVPCKHVLWARSRGLAIWDRWIDGKGRQWHSISYRDGRYVLCVRPPDSKKAVCIDITEFAEDCLREADSGGKR